MGYINVSMEAWAREFSSLRFSFSKGPSLGRSLLEKASHPGGGLLSGTCLGAYPYHHVEGCQLPGRGGTSFLGQVYQGKE